MSQASSASYKNISVLIMAQERIQWPFAEYTITEIFAILVPPYHRKGNMLLPGYPSDDFAPLFMNFDNSYYQRAA